MKDGIHPNYPAATIACACGNTFITHSTRGDFQVDVCGACHPFYTGTQKLLDTAGRVDRFRKRYQAKPAQVKAQAAEVPPANPPTVVPPATQRSADLPESNEPSGEPTN
jgi:large subunit ribosomal protein L31